MREQVRVSRVGVAERPGKGAETVGDSAPASQGVSCEHREQKRR